MKYERKYLAVVLALATVGAANADVLDVKNGGATFQGTSTLSLSTQVLDDFSTDHISVASHGVAKSVIEKDMDGYYTRIDVAAPLTLLTLDTDSLEVLRLGATGGLTLTMPALKSVTSGGSLTLTDLTADLGAKTIYATIIGSNGVGTIDHFALWTFATVTGQTVYTGSGLYESDISDLALTSDGSSKFSQALGMVDRIRLPVEGPSFGTLHTMFQTTLCCAPPPSVIPEPANHTLMGLGLGLGVLGAMAARRKSV